MLRIVTNFSNNKNARFAATFLIIHNNNELRSSLDSEPIEKSDQCSVTTRNHINLQVKTLLGILPYVRCANSIRKYLNEIIYFMNIDKNSYSIDILSSILKNVYQNSKICKIVIGNKFYCICGWSWANCEQYCHIPIESMTENITREGLLKILNSCDILSCPECQRNDFSSNINIQLPVILQVKCKPEKKCSMMEKISMDQSKYSLFGVLKYPNILYNKLDSSWYKYTLGSMDLEEKMVDLNIDGYTELWYVHGKCIQI